MLCFRDMTPFQFQIGHQWCNATSAHASWNPLTSSQGSTVGKVQSSSVSICTYSQGEITVNHENWITLKHGTKSMGHTFRSFGDRDLGLVGGNFPTTHRITFSPSLIHIVDPTAMGKSGFYGMLCHGLSAKFIPMYQVLRTEFCFLRHPHQATLGLFVLCHAHEMQNEEQSFSRRTP